MVKSFDHDYLQVLDGVVIEVIGLFISSVKLFYMLCHECQSVEEE